jgi:site-specific DNA-cytosine methylase
VSIGGFKFLNKKYPKRNFEIIWANEIDKDFCKTYQKNFKHDIVEDDIRKVLNGDASINANPFPTMTEAFQTLYRRIIVAYAVAQ